jgi:hypothetical protein
VSGNPPLIFAKAGNQRLPRRKELGPRLRGDERNLMYHPDLA